ncbi:MAG TPA: hypothetical protein VIO11_09915 [Candidatus Methanoperedens sp.]
MPNTERIQYLTKKAQRGVIAPYERDELASLLGRRPQEFQDTNGLNQLIGFALAAIAAAIIIKLLTDEGD